jgi:hypothetical protein
LGALEFGLEQFMTLPREYLKQVAPTAQGAAAPVAPLAEKPNAIGRASALGLLD